MPSSAPCVAGEPKYPRFPLLLVWGTLIRSTISGWFEQQQTARTASYTLHLLPLNDAVPYVLAGGCTPSSNRMNLSVVRLVAYWFLTAE